MWRKPVETPPIRKVVYMEDSPLLRARRRPRITIGQTIKRNLELNDLSLDISSFMIGYYGVFDLYS